MKTCLLVKTKDNRKFLTDKSNLSHLEEFANTFRPEILLVKTQDQAEILEIKELAPAFCDSTYDSNPNYQVISKLFPKRTRSVILKDASKIRQFIRSTLLTGNSLSLKSLKKRYSELGLTDACLCGHFADVRKELESTGKSFKKTGAGEYCLE